ncbi:hypothetical protein HDU96_000090 [Phlyctochytrium bullatum]|nr:hypothetical protein HDU96_000090 [Phlyctochytrium bullatum]
MASADIQTLYINLRAYVDPKAWYENATDKDAANKSPERLERLRLMARLDEDALIEHAFGIQQQLDSAAEGSSVEKVRKQHPQLVEEALDAAVELQRRYHNLSEIQFPVYHPPASASGKDQFDPGFSSNAGGGAISGASGPTGLGFSTAAGI